MEKDRNKVILEPIKIKSPRVNDCAYGSTRLAHSIKEDDVETIVIAVQGSVTSSKEKEAKEEVIEEAIVEKTDPSVWKRVLGFFGLGD